jgi:nanoRNase/pAp phosphatase (c-di-AMP/oligoRNAs hydrolase)
MKEKGGGGRNNMGGFQLKTPTNSNNYEERRDSLLEDFQEFIKQKI